MADISEEATVKSIREAGLTYYNADPAQLDTAQISFLLSLSSTAQPCQISVGKAQLNGVAGVLLKGQSTQGHLYEAFCSEQSLDNCRIRTTTALSPTPPAGWIKGRIAKTKLGTDGYLYTIIASTKASPELTFFGPDFALP
jgi:hypothetical protein